MRFSAVAKTTCYTWSNTSGKVETQLHKITEQNHLALKGDSFSSNVFDLFDFDWFRSEGWWLQSALQTLGIILLLIIIIITLVYCIFSKALNMFVAIDHPANDPTNTGTSEKEQREWFKSRLI